MGFFDDLIWMASCPNRSFNELGSLKNIYNSKQKRSTTKKNMQKKKKKINSLSSMMRTLERKFIKSVTI